MADRHRASGDAMDSEVIQNAFGQRFRKEIIKDFIKFKIEKV
jgi:hypothetical protein